MVEILQAKIDQTEYWDLKILDFHANFFGDSESKDFEGFYDVLIDLSIMTAKIMCKDVNVEKVSNSTLNIFWWEDGDQTERR